MYKSILSAILLSSMLVGCGASAQDEDKQAITMQQAAHANEYKFVASFLGQTGQAEGYASNQQDAVYDALAWMASNTFKPGTDAYKAMLTENGLSVLIVASKDGKAYKGIVRMMKDGLHIDVFTL